MLSVFTFLCGGFITLSVSIGVNLPKYRFLFQFSPDHSMKLNDLNLYCLRCGLGIMFTLGMKSIAEV